MTAQAQGEMEKLLAHAGWLRALATYLVRSPADADDLVQETFAAALRAPPDATRPPRPWLAQVLRNVMRMGARERLRRRGRELAVTADAGSEPADAALERLQLHRELAELVLALEEPYRTAVLLRFFEGREPSEIAATLQVPAGTIRWRVSEGVRRLRARLDERHPGPAWRAVLLPLVPSARAAKVSSGAGLTAMGKVALLAGGLAATAVVGGALWRRAGRGPLEVVAGRARPLAASSATNAKNNPNDEEKIMNEAVLKKTVILFGLVLPALASAGEADKPLPREDAINACVWYKEVAVKCRNELADYFATFAKPGTPPETLARYREKALKEIVEEGSGPLPPRREKCAADVEKQPITYGDLATLKKCAARVDDDCKAAIECAKSFRGRGRAKK